MLHHDSFYLMGIKGAAMANIAVLLKQMGKQVGGIDCAEKFPTESVLHENGIRFDTFETAEAIPNSYAVIVYAAAHQGDKHPLVLKAKKKGAACVHQILLLGEILASYPRSVAIAGCHGKTTTASLLAYACVRLQAQASYLVGAPSFAGNKPAAVYPGSAIHGRDIFIIEADEYGLHPPHDIRPKFLFLKPNYAIITNIDFDHPDVYPTFEATRSAFWTFIRGVADGADTPRVIACADNTPAWEMVNRLPENSYVTYGRSSQADYQITEINTRSDGTSFCLSGPDISARFKIALYGEKNVLNAAACVVQLSLLGYKAEQIAAAISGFSGAKRRFELIWQNQNAIVYDDYAHHPDELRAVIAAARAKHPEAAVRVVFQPHTYSRTRALLSQFAEALGQADSAYVLPVFASAREAPPAGSTTPSIAQEARRLGINTVCELSDRSKLQDELKNHHRTQEVVIMAGAGDIYQYHQDVISAYQRA